MSSFFRSNQIDLNTRYKTTGPGKIFNTFFRTNNRDISNNFTLYMHGTVLPTSFFRTNNTDFGNLLQVDNFTSAIELSPTNTYNMGPWNNNETKLAPAKWIWNITGAASSAPANIFLWFYYSFYYNGNQNQGTIYIAADNFSTTYINGGTGIVSNDSFTTRTSVTFTMLNGFNYIRTSAYNGGSTNNPAGLIITVYDSNSIYVCGTNNTWAMSTSSAYTTGALAYNR
jgi:hypothetical protein